MQQYLQEIVCMWNIYIFIQMYIAREWVTANLTCNCFSRLIMLLCSVHKFMELMDLFKMSKFLLVLSSHPKPYLFFLISQLLLYKEIWCSATLFWFVLQTLLIRYKWIAKVTLLYTELYEHKHIFIILKRTSQKSDKIQIYLTF